MVKFSVFNELSLPFKSHDNIEIHFINFFKVLSMLKERGMKTLRMDEDFKTVELIEDIYLNQFLNYIHDQELKRRIVSLATNGIIIIKTPLIVDEKDEEALLSRNYSFENDKVFIGGLACSDIWNTISISFESNNNWKRDTIVLKKNNEDIDIKHASNVKHLNIHDDFFKELEKENKLNITQDNFWDKKDEFFPKKILFCKELDNQVKKLDKNIFIQAIGILRDIEHGRKIISNYNYSPESLSVHQNPDLKKLRLFTFEKIKICFDNHLKFSSNRIYFLERKDKIYIGYIGKHLKTKKY